MTAICTHDRLRRQCLECDDAEEIATLRAEVERLALANQALVAAVDRERSARLAATSPVVTIGATTIPQHTAIVALAIGWFFDGVRDVVNPRDPYTHRLQREVRELTRSISAYQGNACRDGDRIRALRSENRMLVQKLAQAEEPLNAIENLHARIRDLEESSRDLERQRDFVLGESQNLRTFFDEVAELLDCKESTVTKTAIRRGVERLDARIRDLEEANRGLDEHCARLRAELAKQDDADPRWVARVKTLEDRIARMLAIGEGR